MFELSVIVPSKIQQVLQPTTSWMLFVYQVLTSLVCTPDIATLPSRCKVPTANHREGGV